MKTSYRSEIDGLRAIAVGAVILYHSKIKLLGNEIFKGGFIGVDIFFVISGYLITSIIFKELITTGTFSFKHFYERRARRILPMLIVVMLASFPLAWNYLLPENFIDFSKSILFSLGFTSNFYFHYTGQIYGAEDGLFKPFLHTWSLSVEEQFYILFPIILLITFKYFTKYLIHILILGFIISLGLAEWTSRNYSSISFYFINTRMWELLAGSILAYFEIFRGKRCQNKTLNLILPLTGLILIFQAILLFNDRMLHPSFYTLSPVIGVCLVIWFSNKDEITTKILSTKLFVGIGLISYSLYLWHYPVFAFARITEFFGNNLIIELLSGVIILFLSIISFYLIEKPFRDKNNSIKKISFFLIGLTTFLTISCIYVINKDGIVNRLPSILQKKLKEQNVKLYQKNGSQKIILLGDSHAGALEYSLNEEIKKKELSLYRLTTRMYLKDFDHIVKGKIKPELRENNYKIDEFLKENSNLIIVYHLRWSIKILNEWFDNQEGHREETTLAVTDSFYEPIGIKNSTKEERYKYLAEGTISRINYIINNGHKLILVYPVPEMGFNVPKQLLNRIGRSSNSNNVSVPILSTSYDVYKKRNKKIFDILDSIDHPNIFRVYPHERN
jgi:peptidoglycan/LPS O-acetylase OafA/YrhL